MLERVVSIVDFWWDVFVSSRIRYVYLSDFKRKDWMLVVCYYRVLCKEIFLVKVVYYWYCMVFEYFVNVYVCIFVFLKGS